MNVKVLLIDDDEDDYFITSQYLKEIDEFNVTCSWSYNISDAQKKLKSNDFDVCFIDYRLGAKTGLELLTEAVNGGCNKPLILLTGKGNTAIDKLAVEAGAYDYLIKTDLNSDKLERSIRYALERFKNFKVITDNEKKYRQLFENAISFIFICDENLRFTEGNNASSFFIGYSANELKGHTIFDFIHKAQNSIELKQKIELKKSISNFLLPFKAKSGEIKKGNLFLDYFEDENGRAYWQGLLFDETIREQAELTRIQSEKIEATNRLVATLAHEIRNPLTNIGLSVGGILEEGVKESQVIYTDIIQRSSKRINDIITDLLNSSKKIELEFDSVNLSELMEEIIQVARDSSHLKNVVIIDDIKIKDAYLNLDKDKFKIAILNLVFNAIEASDKETGELRISMIDKNKNMIVEIEDNGCGIAEDELKKLFEPYFTTKKTGMGLGLVSTMNIIKSHGAKIEVSSKIGIGTLFKISIPHG